MGFRGVYLLFLFLIKNIDCGYLLEPHDLCFEQKYLKYQNFSGDILQLKKNLYILHRPVFIMLVLECPTTGSRKCIHDGFEGDIIREIGLSFQGGCRTIYRTKLPV